MLKMLFFWETRPMEKHHLKENLAIAHMNKIIKNNMKESKYPSRGFQVEFLSMMWRLSETQTSSWTTLRELWKTI
jgi:hypothetical protein